MEVISDKPRLARLLEHFLALADSRERWRGGLSVVGGRAPVRVRHDRLCADYDTAVGRQVGSAAFSFNNNLRRALRDRAVPATRKVRIDACEGLIGLVEAGICALAALLLLQGSSPAVAQGGAARGEATSYAALEVVQPAKRCADLTTTGIGDMGGQGSRTRPRPR
jgi:hypothetical protein